ncbi:MAG: SH3 domain-containing protein [Chloroflexota bacterium]|nr:MAG: SH3 domain-containing protein [Chloroflexota bacterium]
MNRRLFFILFVIVLLGLSTGVAAGQNSLALWTISYWDNKNMEGEPVATGTTGVIDYDWGSGSPASGVPSNYWSGEWTAYVDFSPGTYRFFTESDDGVRVFLGWRHIIDDWNIHPPQTNEVTVSLVGGTYSMAVDFFDETGRALLRLGWQRIGPPLDGAGDVAIIPVQTSPPSSPPATQATWLAQYWNGTSHFGDPVVTRNEAAIDHDWGYGSPAPLTIAVDRFSARWSRSIFFDAGSYRFTTQSDDGIRASIGGNTIIDDWNVQALRSNSADVDLAAGTYPVVVEYFEETGVAVARFGWQKTGSPESGHSGVSAMTLTYSLNMRQGPSTTYPIITKLPRGTVVPVVGRTADSSWLQVVYQGATGWIWAAYTSVSGDLTSVPVTF